MSKAKQRRVVESGRVGEVLVACGLSADSGSAKYPDGQGARTS